jgi:hypothetical protein
METKVLEKRRIGYLIAVTGIAVVTGALKLFGEHPNSTTVAALERAAPLACNHKTQVQLDDNLPAVRVDDRAVAEVIYTDEEETILEGSRGARVSEDERQAAHTHR